MAWVAEILRKTHRECAVCKLAPIHMYDPEPRELSALEISPEPTGTALCHACLGGRLGQDLSGFEGRCLVFEPSLGPETYLFQPLEGGPRRFAAPARAAAASALQRLPSPCTACGAAGRFLWVPVDHDAGLWGDDWLPALATRELTARDPLCGRCAAARLARTLEERGLTFEAIIPARGTGDGLMCGVEAAQDEDDEA